MNKYLIFRTDRIGDFLISAILIKLLKENDKSANIFVVASEKNYQYIKEFDYIDNVIKLDNSLFSKIKLILNLRRHLFKDIIIHDCKNRSRIISFFLNSINKPILIKKKNTSHINLIRQIIKVLKYDFYNDCFNTLSYKKNKIENQVQLHFDEKWIHKDYINGYTYIEPTKKELLEFLISLKNKTKKKIIVTTGFKMPNLLNEIIDELKNENIEIYDKLNFLELENITIKSQILISCHGAISHVAAAKNIRQIDIIDKSYNYSYWTEHFRNYNYLYRSDFRSMSNQIIKII